MVRAGVRLVDDVRLRSERRLVSVSPQLLTISRMGPILLTGATGFIGQHLVNRLIAEGFAVKAFIRDNAARRSWGADVEVAKGDVRDIQSIRMAVAGAESVFHLAGKVHDLEEIEDKGEHEEVTAQGTQNLMTAARKSGVKRFIFLSSLSVYGTSCEVVRDETSKCVPMSAYGRAKLKAERCVLDQGAEFGIHVCCLRPAMVYGPGCKGNLPRMIKMIDRGLFPPLPDLRNRLSVVHISNVVDGVMLAATSPAANGQCYIVTDARPYSTRELYETICRGLGKQVPRWHISVGALKALARLGDAIGQVRGRRFLFDSDALEKLIGSAWFSSDKISRELGYLPSITFDNALPELIDWYRKAWA